MIKHEQRAVLSLAAIFSLRMLGLFMILPVFTPYAHSLSGSSANLIGIALGIYGLTQALLQIPMGTLSDKYGRKPIIAIGLLCFAAGSVVAAQAHSIYGVIIGRALQGSGAIGSTLIATVADLTQDENRTKSMALIGMTIGISFAGAVVLGPILAHWVNVNGIFWLTAVLALLGIVVLYTLVPTPTQLRHRDTQALPKLFQSVLGNRQLLRLNFGIFAQHAILTALFIVLPIALTHTALNIQKQWLFYLPILVLSFFMMLPFIIIGEKQRKLKQIFLAAIALIGLAQCLLWQFNTHLWQLSLWLTLFFTGFNLLEASLPSLVSKFAPAGSKGTAMGIYSSCQFFGIFVGGSLGGYLYGHYSLQVIFFANTALAIIWLILAKDMEEPPYLSTLSLSIGKLASTQANQLENRLKTLAGVVDAVVSFDEGTAYLKVDKKIANQDDLRQLCHSFID